MNFQSYLFVLALAVILALAAAPGLASPATAPAETPQLEAGNYCLSCHTGADDRPAQVMAWTGGIDRLEINPCPAAARVQEETYYTERLLLAIDRARADLPGRAETAKIDARTATARQTYSRLLDVPVDSLEAFVSEAQVLRFQLGKSYRQINELDTSYKQQNVLIAGALVTLFLLVALGWGLRNTARFTGKYGGKFRPGFKTLLFVALVFILFSLPIFRVFSQEVASTTEAEQARQTAIDTAGRVADAADRASARAWMLARVGAGWAETNPEAAETALAQALAAAQEKQVNAAALWGEAQAAQEGAIGSPAAQEKAQLAAAQLAAATGRAWPLRLMAEEWRGLDPAGAEKMLELALLEANKSAGIYRDLDMRAIAVTWAGLDPARGLAVAGQINDPALRTWALWELAVITEDAQLYDQAAEAARQVTDPVQKARLLREIAVRAEGHGKITISSGEQSLFDEALAALAGVEGPALAYALSDLAAAAGDTSLANSIDPAYPAARAAAQLRLEQFEPAWDAAAEIEDPFDRAHVQAAIAVAAASPDLAGQVGDSTLRDKALRDVTLARRDAALVEQIASPYYRVQALTALEQVETALAEAENLSDGYPLRALGAALAGQQPDTALALVEKLEREVDKSDVLTAVAHAAGDRDIFERALGMALAARVRGDALAPVEASLDLARGFTAGDSSKAEAAFNQAYDTALRISIK